MNTGVLFTPVLSECECWGHCGGCVGCALMLLAIFIERYKLEIRLNFFEVLKIFGCFLSFEILLQ